MDETRSILTGDPDGFLHSLNKWDLFARHVDTLDQYIYKIKYSGIDFTKDDRDVLVKNANKADSLFNNPEISHIPWVFAKTTYAYEEGFPHTRNGVIFMSEPLDVKTLMHEKMHVYEKQTRLDPTKYGFERIGLRRDVLRLRSNPDTDQYVYKSKDGIIMVGTYNSDRPLGLTDAKNVGKNEHPYEYLAYSL